MSPELDLERMHGSHLERSLEAEENTEDRKVSYRIPVSCSLSSTTGL